MLDSTFVAKVRENQKYGLRVGSLKLESLKVQASPSFLTARGFQMASQALSHRMLRFTSHGS
jgi:hypothetical protein